MKKYISKNWNKILITIGSCVMVWILIVKFTAEKTLLKDYIKYGKDVTPSTGGSSGALDAAKENVSSVWNSVDPNLTKLAMIMMAGILIVVLLTSLASAAGGDKKDAKKK